MSHGQGDYWRQLPLYYMHAGTKVSAVADDVGYYGVTPVVLAGTVLVKVQDGGHAVPIRSVQVAVRCYEAKESMRASRERTVWEKVRHIWQPPPGTQDMILGEWQQSFKLSIPPEVADLARGTQTLREWRVRWRLEVVVEHVPIPHVGHRVAQAYDLQMNDHRSPSPSLPSPPAGMIIGTGPTATHVHINPPPTACGPAEELAVSFSVRPEDPSASIKKLQVVLDRRLELLDDRRPSEGGLSEDYPNTRRSRVGNIFQRNASGSGSGSPHSSRSASEDCKRVIVTRIAETQCEVPKPGSSGAVWSLGSLQLPRRGHHWDMGETERTEFADISFEARLKVTLKSKRGGSQKELVSQPIPVLVVGATAEERAKAQKAWERLDFEPSSKRRLVSRRHDAQDVYQRASSSESTSGQSKHSGNVTPPRKSASPGSSGTRLDDRDLLPSPSATVVDGDTSLPSIHSFLGYNCPTPASSTGESAASAVIVSPPPTDVDYEMAVRRSGRRISMTSEDDDVNPRARQKLGRASEPPYPPSMLESAPRRRRLNLPSLDALGLGLPKVKEERPLRHERPATAPSFGVYSAKPPPFGSRPQTSTGPAPSSFAFVMPAPRR